MPATAVSANVNTTDIFLSNSTHFAFGVDGSGNANSHIVFNGTNLVIDSDSDAGSGGAIILDSGGNGVGIGTTSPAEALDVVGNAKVSGETYSVTGTISVPSATWTTIRAFGATEIEQGIITVFFGGTTAGLIGGYNKLYDGGSSGANAAFITRIDAADVRFSGDNLQVFHNTGTTVTASWYCLITRAGA